MTLSSPIARSKLQVMPNYINYTITVNNSYSTLNIKLNSVVSVILKKLQNKVKPEQKKKEPPKSPAEKSSKQWRTVEDMKATVPSTKTAIYKDEQDTTLTRLEKIQTIALVCSISIQSLTYLSGIIIFSRN